MTARWWEDAPQAVCAACGGLTWSRSTPAFHRRCKPRAAPRPSESWAERKRRATAVRRHVEQFGQVCPGWLRPPHAVVPPNKLSADHVRSVASTGDESGELQILCRTCNSSKRERSGRATGTLKPAAPQYPGPSRAWSVTRGYIPSGTC